MQFVLVPFKGEEGILQKKEKNYNDIPILKIPEKKIKIFVIIVHFSMNIISFKSCTSYCVDHKWMWENGAACDFDFLSEASSVDLTELRGNATTRTLFTFPYSLDSWRKNRFHICLIQEISETGDGRGGGGGGCMCESESEFECVGERERRSRLLGT